MSASKRNHEDDLDIEIELSVQSFETKQTNISDPSVFVEINKSSSQFILEYSASDVTQELGGVLLGNCIEKDGQYNVCVEGAIEARFTEAARGSVTFTHKTWEYINQIRDEKYPHQNIVGWFHTHPGFGIFLSGHDKFIHQNFFNLPWQVAYVVDPLAGEHGFFGWCNNDLKNIPFKAELGPRANEMVETQPVANKIRTTAPARAAAVAAVILLLFSNGYYYLSNQDANRRVEELQHSLSEMESDLANRQIEIAELQAVNNEFNSIIRELGLLDPLVSYTVSEGDTLWGISEKYLGEGERYMELAELNKLIDPDLLVTGTRLLIPLNKVLSE